MPKKIMLQCASNVNKNAVRREIIDGVEHIVISSYTMPDNIIMNGGMYPAEEIAKSFNSLERTLAPVEHPLDNDGNFISATDPQAIHNFHAGAFNVNVTRDNGRVHIEKFINVQEAIKSDKGKRLLDRINELETNDNPRPIHTSTGVFLVPNILDKPITNADGNEYTWVASEMTFDHDAILLDNVGAAQPKDGVGMAVNSQGEECKIERFQINMPDGQSQSDVRDSINQKLNDFLQRDVWIQDIFENVVIYENNDILFSVPYSIDDDGIVTIMGIPLTVEREVSYTPKINQKGDDMKEAILNALKEAEIDSTGMDDTALLKAYDSIQANQSGEPGDEEEVEEGDNGEDIASVVANALAPLVEKIDGLESKINAGANDEHDKYAEIVGNSDKYAGLTVEACKALKTEDLKTMAANCGSAVGIPLTTNAGSDDAFTAPSDMQD